MRMYICIKYILRKKMSTLTNLVDFIFKTRLYKQVKTTLVNAIYILLQLNNLDFLIFLNIYYPHLLILIS